MFVENNNLVPMNERLWLSSPTMHGQELKYIKEAYDTNWMSTIGKNIDEVERISCELIGRKFAVGLSCGTNALHLAIKLTGIKPGDRVFCSDMTFCATLNAVTYEGAIPVFIDSEYETWNMDPKALEKAFEKYPEVRVIVVAWLYGTPGRIDEIKNIARRHNAIIIEDAAEALGAYYKGQSCGSFGDMSVISFNGNKIITGSSGGCLLTDNKEWANKARKLSTQARERAPWYQHEEIGYNYRMSNLIAGVIRGQFPYLKDHIQQKKIIYERYKEGFKDIPVEMNPIIFKESIPNYWLSCLIIKSEAMSEQVRSDNTVLYKQEKGKTCPSEILDILMKYNAEGRPIWKPMHMQPIYRINEFFTRFGNGRALSNAYTNEQVFINVGEDIFNRGLCLPSDNKMTSEQQNMVIELVKTCFR